MLAKVNKNYYGIFGHFDEETKLIKPKTRKSAAFRIYDDALFERLKAKGVLVEAEETEEAENIVPEEAVQDSGEEPEEEVTLENMTMGELKALAKEYGISYKVGMSKAALIEALSEKDGEEPPSISAEEPE
jgi:hypothetical protein